MTASHSLSALGYPALFIWIFLEQIGLPIPASPFLFAAGLMIDSGTFAIVPSLLIALVACLIPDLIWYYIGKNKGGAVLNLVCKVSWKPDTCISKTKSVFTRYGNKTLIFAKFVPGLNTLAPPLMGMAEASVASFLIYDAIGSLLWAAVPLFAGIYFKAAIPKPSMIGVILRTHLTEMIAIAVGAILLWRFYNRYIYRQNLFRELKTSISPVQLKELIDRRQAPFIIDVRGKDEIAYSQTTIPGAHLMEYHEIEKRYAEIPLHRPIVTYCDCPHDEGSVGAAQLLRKLGAKSVLPLHGGIEAWEKLGFELATIGKSIHSVAALEPAI